MIMSHCSCITVVTKPHKSHSHHWKTLYKPRDRRRDGSTRRRRTSLEMESRHRKVGHTPTHAGAWNPSRRRRAVCGGAWITVFQRGFLRRVDRPRAPRNLRSPAREELARKSHWRRGDLTAAEGFGRRIK